MDGASLQGESLMKLQGSPLGRKLKEFVQTTQPVLRADVLPLAFQIFPDDQQVLQAYQKDLLDPNLNKSRVSFNLFKSAQVRYKLFKFMVDNISNVEYYESPTVDATIRQRRLATAADWLAKAMDGYLDKQLEIKRHSRRYADGNRTIPIAIDVKQRMLQSFFDIGSRSSDRKIKQILLPKLEKLKESLVQAGEKRTGWKRDDFRGHLSSQEKTALADLDYVIAVFQGNSPAELPPNSKLIKNNESKVASVTKSETALKNEPAVKKETATKHEPITKSEPALKIKTVYQGKTFDQWRMVMQSERDPKVQFTALEAGLAIMETKQQQQQILEGTRAFMKTLDRKFSPKYLNIYRRQTYGGENKKLVQFNDLNLRVLNSCDRGLVFDFFKAEVEAGTPFSQQVCSNWVRVRANKTGILDRYEELEDTFAKNFDKPGVRAMVSNLMDGASLQNEALTQLQESALGKTIKEFVQTATPMQRLEVLSLAFGIFPDDQQIFQPYQKDLLDPNLNYPVREKLFQFMVEELSNETYYEALGVDATTRQKRLATSVDWLAKVMEGYLAVGDQHLTFRGYSYKDVSRLLLQRFHDIGIRSSDPKIRQRLLPKLEKFKDRIIADKLSTHDENHRIRTLADLDYVIAVFQGNTPAKLPPKSKLRKR